MQSRKNQRQSRTLVSISRSNWRSPRNLYRLRQSFFGQGPDGAPTTNSADSRFEALTSERPRPARLRWEERTAVGGWCFIVRNLNRQQSPKFARHVAIGCLRANFGRAGNFEY